MLTEGKININITIQDNKVNNIDIASSQLLYISQHLQGKKTNEIGAFIDMFYHLCPVAHNFAFLKLLNTTKHINFSENETLAYQLLLDLEVIKEHCFTIFSRWQHNLNVKISQQIVDIMYSVKQIKLNLFNSNPFSLDPKILQSGDNIKAQILKLEQQLLILLVDGNTDVFTDISRFNIWLKGSNSCVAVFLKYLQKSNYHNLANVQAHHLPKNICQTTAKLLSNQEFIKKPFYANKTHETTPLSRQCNNHLIKQLSNIHGDSVFTRAVAQILDIFIFLEKVKKNYIKIKAENICYKNKSTANKTSAAVELEAARGRLIHQMHIENNHIVDYQILAPTQWNFHPHGLLSKQIKTLTYKTKEEFIKKVALCVNAIDPCVGFNIEIKYA